MRPSKSLLLYVSALAVATACTQPSAELSPADVASVKESLAAYTKHALAANWDEWGKTLTTDVVYMPPNMKPLVGRAAAVEFGKGFPKMLSLMVTADEVRGAGDIAFAKGHYSYTVTMPDGSTAADSGSFLDTFKKQADGSWPHSHAIWHSDLPVPAPAAPAAKAASK